MNIINFILENYQSILSAIVAILGGFIVIFSLIPGEQPEKFLQSIVDFLSKFSIKKKWT